MNEIRFLEKEMKLVSKEVELLTRILDQRFEETNQKLMSLGQAHLQTAPLVESIVGILLELHPEKQERLQELYQSNVAKLDELLSEAQAKAKSEIPNVPV